ncbi:hypothetical protein ABZW03_37435, partial [Kitasatospora sp. NPDC004799]
MAKVPNVLAAAAPAALTAAGGLVGGYGVARWSGRRELGGAVLAAAGTARKVFIDGPDSLRVEL